jgi:hypothetical protein
MSFAHVDVPVSSYLKSANEDPRLSLPVGALQLWRHKQPLKMMETALVLLAS